jgi:hypothetical protein
MSVGTHVSTLDFRDQYEVECFDLAAKRDKCVGDEAVIVLSRTGMANRRLCCPLVRVRFRVYEMVKMREFEGNDPGTDLTGLTARLVDLVIWTGSCWNAYERKDVSRRETKV